MPFVLFACILCVSFFWCKHDIIVSFPNEMHNAVVFDICVITKYLLKQYCEMFIVYCLDIL